MNGYAAASHLGNTALFERPVSAPHVQDPRCDGVMSHALKRCKEVCKWSGQVFPLPQYSSRIAGNFSMLES